MASVLITPHYVSLAPNTFSEQGWQYYFDRPLTIKHLLIGCADFNDVRQTFYQVPSSQDFFKTDQARSDFRLLESSWSQLPTRLFYDFTENINTKLNVSMFYLRFSTIFIQGLRFVDCLLGVYKTKTPNIKPPLSPLRWLFYDFTENINIQLNVNMFYLRFSTIFIQGLRFIDCLLGFYKTKMVFVLRFVGLRSSCCTHPDVRGGPSVAPPFTTWTLHQYHGTQHIGADTPWKSCQRGEKGVIDAKAWPVMNTCKKFFFLILK